ncbi:unnamed protein product [Clavelina lepadiformis]|uniref:BSD domain-containing protein n=1 Tax=Clavelina lepadiformis TaxID=159417 RepID=A0ABP0GHN0_CLALP
MKDMKEFTQTVKTDTSKLVADTASSMKEQLKIKVNMDEASHATKVVTNSISEFLGNVVHQVTPIAPNENENDDSTMFMGTSSGVKVMSPAEARLFTLQTSPATYCNEPDNLVEFDLWLKDFELDKKKEELSLLMLDSKEVRSLYTKLVPEAVSHVDFWTRYFYKKDELEKAEQRRVSIMERAAAKDTELTWDDEDDFDMVDCPATQSNDNLETKVENIQNLPEKNNADLAEMGKNDITDKPPANHLKHDDTPQEAKMPTVTEIATIKSSTSSNVPTPELPTVSDSSIDIEVDNTVGVSVEITNQTSTSSTPSDADKSKEMSKDKVASSEKQETDIQDIKKAAENDSTIKDESPQKLVESSSGDSSDWEKEFDLEMTEDEIKEALLEDDADGEIEGWEEWE